LVGIGFLLPAAGNSLAAAQVAAQLLWELPIERCAATQHHLIILVGAVSRACRDGGIECRTPLTAAKGMSVILAPSQYK